ncbi:DUF3006 domain-containing protein [Candidatus Falkowbacteria bacterium]|nr:DUF3006 domain-containing protein [Candidatus Falkowbacteria bacterium]
MPEPSLKNSDYFITGTLDRFEAKNAVIIIKDGNDILWPIAALPPSVKQGEVVKLNLTTDKLEKNNREQTIKNLLNQILKK